MFEQELYVICHNIRSLYNVGAIFRTADAAGVTRLYLGGYTGHPPRKEISKTALGAERFVLWERCAQTWRLLEQLQREGTTIAALENIRAESNVSLFEHEPRFPMALLLGNEVGGLSRAMLKRADRILHIPMHGEKQSLNVAVAFGVAVYQMNRHRR